ncbi:MAG: magnesium and cobalt transport protein CorA [Gammaproteobacteria bacterium RIFCSPHIGHO2_12_FULL_37_14]|nr:MAG: magnesium and cobalt transport protein CorA [Gammaproteobacteria bacterium RIFCSPHIGHO2_12_FULL_37_14]
MFSEIRKRVKKTGHAPGSALYTGEPANTAPQLTVVTYNANDYQQTTGTRLEDCFTEQKPNVITWINVEGLHDTDLIKQMGKLFNLHPLTVEDILNVDQRPKVEEFEGYLFITLKVLLWRQQNATFVVKQLSLVLGKNFILSFQELDTTLFDSLCERLQSSPNQRLRKQGADYLVYRLIDTVVDAYFLVLEALGETIEQVEKQIITAPNPQNTRTIYRLKQQLLLLRKAIWPMREAINHLMHSEDKLFTKYTRVYLRDVYDHTMQAIDALEISRDMLSSMLDMYLSSLTNRMNEIIKTLTIISTIFIPITSIASIYGMNFTYMPGLHWSYGFTTIMSIMGLVVIAMMFYFWKRKWV